MRRRGGRSSTLSETLGTRVQHQEPATWQWGHLAQSFLQSPPDLGRFIHEGEAGMIKLNSEYMASPARGSQSNLKPGSRPESHRPDPPSTPAVAAGTWPSTPGPPESPVLRVLANRGGSLQCTRVLTRRDAFNARLKDMNTHTHTHGNLRQSGLVPSSRSRPSASGRVNQPQG